MPSVKNCPPEKIYNPDSKRCVLKTGKIGKAILAGTDIHSTKKDVGIKPHKKQVEKSKKKKECPPDKIYNEATKRCVSKTGKIGKAILLSKKGQIIQKQDKIIRDLTKSKKKQILQKQDKAVPKKKQKVCKENEVLNPENNKCYSQNGKIGRELIFKKIYQENKNSIENYIHESYPYNRQIVETVLRENPNLKLYMEYEDFFYKGGRSFTPNADFEDKYYRWNKMDKTKTLSEKKDAIDTKDRYDFSKLQSVFVPYVNTIYSTKNSLAKGLSSASNIHLTPFFRYPLCWLIEQHEYIASLPKIERDFLRYYTQSGYREMNAFVHNKKKPNLNMQANNQILKKIYIILFQKSPTNSEIKENFYILYTIAIEKMNKIIKNAPPLPEDILVFKGLKNNFKTEHKSFISTSLSLDVGNSFQNSKCCKVYFLLKKGTHALAILFLSPHNEKEILLPYDIQLNLIQKDSTKINTTIQRSNSIDVYEARN